MIAERLKGAVRAALITPTARSTARSLTARLPRILCYHGFAETQRAGCVSAAEFRRQLAYLTEHYTIVPLGEIVRALEAGAPLPTRAVAITVDDGYRNFLTVALPILREFGVPATLAVCSTLTAEVGWIWADRFQWLCDHAAGVEELEAARRQETLLSLKRDSIARRDARIAEFEERAGVEIPVSPPTQLALMSPSEVREVAASGLVEIAAHTCTHPIVARLDDEAARREISDCKGALEEIAGEPVTTFVYPNGLAGDYLPQHAQVVRDAGYTAALVSSFGLVQRGASPYSLPRVGGAAAWGQFLKYVDGVEYLQRRIAHAL